MFRHKKVYNFTTLAPEVLGEVYKNMKVKKGSIGLEDAVRYGNVIDLNTKLKIFIPNLPKPSDDEYVLFETVTGEEVILSYSWIDLSSIQQTSVVNLTISITNIDLSDKQMIENTLRSLGYNNITMTVV